MTCVALRSHHAASSAATVPAAIVRSAARFSAANGYLSVLAVRKRFQLGIAVDPPQVFIRHKTLGRRRLGKRAVRAHELADAGEPLVDIGLAAGAIHDLQLLRE